ncbi:hypothetical protein KKB40_04280 [Patescibacteria group bacterium]|nr:hypothetical protein [Patescibacteria group bacterium]
MSIAEYLASCREKAEAESLQQRGKLREEIEAGQRHRKAERFIGRQERAPDYAPLGEVGIPIKRDIDYLTAQTNEERWEIARRYATDQLNLSGRDADSAQEGYIMVMERQRKKLESQL